MEVDIAFDLNKTREIGWQEAFPPTVRCVQRGCKGEARLGFVAYEKQEKGGKFVCQLYENDPEHKKLWLHDLCSVAVYFCEKCLEPTALYNQA